MGLISRLHGKLVFLDTAPIIYFVEKHPRHSKVLTGLFSAIDAGRIRAVTSTITLLEVLVVPLRQGRFDLAD